MSRPRLVPVGECALSVEFGDSVDPAISARVLALDRAVAEAAIPGVTECVPTYRALLIHFDPLGSDPAELRSAIAGLAEAAADDPHEIAARSWQVPVCYGGEFGVDLTELAARHGMTEAAAIALHSGAVYRVYMIGFAPGFAYLGGLPDALHTPRRVEPRLSIPPGSVSIGGAQTAITSVAVPSGWHLIGRTPFAAFDPGREPPFLFGPGDRVRFLPIGPDEWHGLAGRIARGEYRPAPEERA
jgi:KipI family sensor histidine kinase inhibitor